MAALLKLPFNSPNHTEINKKEEANLLNFLFFVSGYQDSNLGPPAPKAGALTGLRYTPKLLIGVIQESKLPSRADRGAKIRHLIE